MKAIWKFDMVRLITAPLGTGPSKTPGFSAESYSPRRRPCSPGQAFATSAAAVIGAAAAITVVTVSGIAVRAPLTRVPENWMKFAVGVMLTSFGTFWGTEGAGATWPGHDAALLVLVPVVALAAEGCIGWLHSRRARGGTPGRKTEIVPP